MEVTQIKKRKHYAGDLRTLGTKDYSLILTNLMNYRHKLDRETDEQKIGSILLKIAEKLKELGFRGASKTIKKKVGRRKQGKFQDITEKKKQDSLAIALKNWKYGKKKQDEAKEKIKKKDKKKTVATN